MRKEACLKNCDFQVNGKCELYKIRLQRDTVPDPYDEGVVETFVKCQDCLEKEISYDIDDKVMEIYSFYHAFTAEMDNLFKELDKLVKRRKSIYE